MSAVLTRAKALPRWSWLLFGGLVVVALALRTALWNRPVQCDEAAAYLRYVVETKRPIIDFVSRYSLPNHHGLHGLVVVLLGEAGWTFPWVRLPALLAGLAVLPLTYGVTRMAFGRSAAALAALMVACSIWCVEVSVNARGYSLGTCLVLAASVAILRCVRCPRVGTWVTAGIFMGMAVYTVHTTVYFVLAVAVWSAWPSGNNRANRRRGGVLAVATALATTALLFTPIIIHNDFGNVIHNKFVVPLSRADFLSLLPAQLWKYVYTFAGGVLPWPLLAVLVLLGGVAAVRQRAAAAALPIIVLAVVLPAAALQCVLPPPRTLTFLLPFAYALAAVGTMAVARLVERRLGPQYRAVASLPPCTITVLILAISTHSFLSGYSHPRIPPGSSPDLKAAVEVIAGATEPTEPLFAQESLIPIIRYHLRALGRPREIVRRTDKRLPHAVLVWKPRAGLSKQMIEPLALYRYGPVLYDNGEVRVQRVYWRTGEFVNNDERTDGLISSVPPGDFR